MLAQSTGNDIFGTVSPPPGINPDFKTGVPELVNVALKTLIVGAGLFTLINLILAGYAFLSAGDDPKKIEGAWAKIYQSVIGLLFAAGAFVLAAIFGQLIFGDPTALLNIKFFGVGNAP